MKADGTVIVRGMTEADLPDVLLIERDCFPDPWTGNMFLDSMRLDYYLFLTAEQAGTGAIAGYAGLMNISGEGNIMNIAVKKPFRRHGIAEQLLTELMRHGTEMGVVDFTLEVRTSNIPAIALYEKLGFRTEGIRKGYYERPREDAFIMWRRGGKSQKGKIG